jgi:sulfite oxidase
MFSRGKLLINSRNFTSINRSLHQQFSRNSKKLKYITIIGGCALSLTAIDYLKRQQNVHYAKSKTTTSQTPDAHLKVRKDLPTFGDTDLNSHNNPKSGIWVSYGIGVYDITNFIKQHPGGNAKIMLAAGNAIDPFWNIYQQHNNKEVLELLETYRIGNLNAEDQPSSTEMFDAWSDEPKRNPILRPASQRPFNAEPPPEILGKTIINMFFGRWSGFLLSMT